MKRVIFIFIAALIFTAGAVYPETIELISGRVVEGEIIARDDQSITVDVHGITLDYYFADIKLIDGKSPQKAFIPQKELALTHLLEGLVYAGNNNFPDALKQFRAGKKLNPDDENIGGAIKVIQDLQIKTISADTAGLILEALRLRAHTQYPQAIEILQKAKTNAPRYPETYYFLGLSFEQEKDYTRALTLYQEAQKLNPLSSKIPMRIGMIFMRQQDYPQALKTFYRASQKKPQRAYIYLYMAKVYLALNQPQHALTHFQKALRLNPNHSNTHYHLGKMYHSQDQYQKARNHLIRAGELFKKEGDRESLKKVDNLLKTFLYNKQY